jgi:hypothetical protein
LSFPAPAPAQNALFVLSFSYVRPEPVLANAPFLHLPKNGFSKKEAVFWRT